MSTAARRLVLGDLERAELYQGLGRALSAGLDAGRALAALDGICGGALDAPLRRVAGAVRKGTALAPALERQGLAAAADRSLLAAGEASGTLDRVCERLARRYARAGARWRTLRGKLLLPVAVLVIAVLVLPLPAVAAGKLSVGGYAVQAGAMLALVAAIAKLASMVVRHWRAHGTPGGLTTIARLLPGIGGLSRMHQRADVCERLALALASGVPAADALDAMSRAEGNSTRRADLAAAHGALGGGTGVAGALERAGLLEPPGYAIVAAGEGAGRLDDTLDRVADQLHDELDQRYALLAQWIPVALYLMVAGVIAAGLLG